MRSKTKILYLIVPVLALVATVFCAVVDNQNPIYLLLMTLELVGIGISWKPVTRAVGTRVTIVVLLLSLLVPSAGSILWFDMHPGYLETMALHKVRTNALANTSGPAWAEQNVGRLVVRYQAQDKGASEILAVLPQAVAQVQAAFTRLPDQVYVFVFPDRVTAKTDFGYGMPVGYNGAGMGSDMLVMISPAAWSAEERATKPVGQIVTHEFTHNAAFYMGGLKVPPWLNDGLAVFVAGQIIPSEQEKVVQLAASGHRYSLTEINNMFTGVESLQDVGLGYALSGSVVKFMVDEYSFMKVQQVLVELGSGRKIDEALTAAIGTDSKGLETAWNQSLTAGRGQ